MTRSTLDVNVLVSSINGPLSMARAIVSAWQAHRFVHCTSEHIIQRTLATLSSPDLTRRFTIPAERLRWLEGMLRTQALLIPVLPTDVLAVTDDPEDDTVLATVRLAHADYLVTGDKGLLALETYHGARIVSPRDFLPLLGQ